MSLRKLGLYILAPAFALFALFALGVGSADAATLYFVGTGDTWSTNASWHSSDKACDDSGDSAVPTSSDIAVFGGSCDTSVAIDAAENIAGLTLAAGYTGTVTATTSLDVDGPVEINAGTFDLNGASMTVTGDFTNDDTFTHSNGSVSLDGSGTQSINGTSTFYDLTTSSATSRLVMLEDGQTTTVTNTFTANGANGQITTFESGDAPTTLTTLDVSAATVAVSFLSVSSVTSANGSILCTTGCINRGGNAAWIFSGDDDEVDGGTSSLEIANIIAPGSGASFSGGDMTEVTWSAAADDLDYVELSFSTDGGTTFDVVATDLENDGSYDWEVPNVETLKGMLKLSVYNTSGTEVIFDETNRFSIHAVEEDTAVEDEEMEEEEVQEAFDGVDVVRTDGQTVRLEAGHLFRGETLSGVYLVNADGTRSVFPTSHVFESHGYSFDDVVMVEDDQLSALASGPRVTVAEGQLVKIQSDNRVFEVGANGMLHHISDEATAISLHGADWASLVTDINVVFWGDYTIGSSL